LSGAARVLERCDQLGEISEHGGQITRRFGTEAMREANALVGGWMEEAGLAVREDALGNLIGRREGGPKALMLGSHLDTVVDGGRYDGPLGVIAAIEIADRVRDPLPFALEVVGFADEEGARFGTTYLGSSVVAGQFKREWLGFEDSAGVKLGDILRDLPAGARDPGELLAYVELHIEQGPELERLGEPLGVVTAIAGQSHAEVCFGGEAGHAGTVPMGARHDALAGAAEWVLAVEGVGPVATVGELRVRPGVRNVIPGEVSATLDLRDPGDEVRRTAVAELRTRAEEIAARRGLHLRWEDRADMPAIPMDERLTALLGDDFPHLVSGAGHDAGMMAQIAPAAMLFVRCRGGISHHPDESVEEADVAAALDALERFLRAL
jgi:allantoate deiminase